MRAALDLLAEGGYSAASVQAVARRAGVATGTVYRHFPSKADLVAEVFRRASQREVDTLVSVGADLGARPRGSRPGSRSSSAARWPSPPAPTRCSPSPSIRRSRPSGSSFRRAYADLFAAALREGVDSGELAPCDVDLVAAAIVGALGEALLGPLARRDTGGRARHRPAVVRPVRHPAPEPCPRSRMTSRTRSRRSLDVDLLAADVALGEGLEREGAGWAVDRVRDAGVVAGSTEA